MHAVAYVLANHDGAPADVVRRRFDGLLGAMRRHRAKAGTLAGAVDHFRKVASRDRPGLFHCYQVADLPRTNNALEQAFGSSRYHERRATGRKTASPGTVVRGSVRLIAGAGTRLAPPSGRDLARVDRVRWQGIRKSLDRRRHTRTLQSRFRRNPDSYLADLESQARQLTLPP